MQAVLKANEIVIIGEEAKINVNLTATKLYNLITKGIHFTLIKATDQYIQIRNFDNLLSKGQSGKIFQVNDF